jgi:hypothetical protein
MAGKGSKWCIWWEMFRSRWLRRAWQVSFRRFFDRSTLFHNDKSLDLDMLDIQSLNKAASEDGELPEVCNFYDTFHLADFYLLPPQSNTQVLGNSSVCSKWWYLVRGIFNDVCKGTASAVFLKFLS